MLYCKEIELTLMVEGSSSSSTHDHDFRMEKSVAIEGFDSFRQLNLCGLDICASNGEELTAMLSAKINNPTKIEIEIGAAGLGVDVEFANQKVGYAKIENICFKHSGESQHRIPWQLQPSLNNDHSKAFISRCLLGHEEIPITLHIPVRFTICGHNVALDSLVVPAKIKGIGFRLIQGIRSYWPLTKIFSTSVAIKFSIENPISADLQIRFIEVVAFDAGFAFIAKQELNDFVLTQRNKAYWSPKLVCKITNWEGTSHNSQSDKVKDIFVISANITIRTPGTNRGLDIQNLSLHLRNVPLKTVITL